MMSSTLAARAMLLAGLLLSIGGFLSGVGHCQTKPMVKIPFSGDFPEFVIIRFNPKASTTEGRISATLREEPYSFNCPDYVYDQLAEMPFQVTLQMVDFPSDKIDSATRWVILSAEGSPPGLPLERENVFNFHSGPGQQVVLRFDEGAVWGENLAFFDGYQWKLYIFKTRISPFFYKTDLAVSPVHGVFFGTEFKALCGADYGAQGICRLSEEGVVERVFWPPLLRRWQGEENLGSCDALMEQNYWDITALRFSSPNTLWAGMFGAVLRLDLDRDWWTLFDEYNSPIQDHVSHIATAQGSDSIRCVCREYRFEGFHKLPKRGCANIFRIEGDQVTREPLSEEAQVALNELGPIVSDPSGTIWFLGSGSIWRSDGKGTRRIATLPAEKCSHFCLDSSGRFWTAAGMDVWVQDTVGWRYLSGQILQGKDPEKRRITVLGEDPLGRIWAAWGKELDPHKFGASVLGQTARKLLEQSLGPPPGNE